jgi:hypothetical protein
MPFDSAWEQPETGRLRKWIINTPRLVDCLFSAVAVLVACSLVLPMFLLPPWPQLLGGLLIAFIALALVFDMMPEIISWLILPRLFRTGDAVLVPATVASAGPFWLASSPLAKGRVIGIETAAAYLRVGFPNGDTAVIPIARARLA